MKIYEKFIINYFLFTKIFLFKLNFKLINKFLYSDFQIFLKFEV